MRRILARCSAANCAAAPLAVATLDHSYLRSSGSPLLSLLLHFHRITSTVYKHRKSSWGKFPFSGIAGMLMRWLRHWMKTYQKHNLNTGDSWWPPRVPRRPCPQQPLPVYNELAIRPMDFLAAFISVFTSFNVCCWNGRWSKRNFSPTVSQKNKQFKSRLYWVIQFVLFYVSRVATPWIAV